MNHTHTCHCLSHCQPLLPCHHILSHCSFRYCDTRRNQIGVLKNCHLFRVGFTYTKGKNWMKRLSPGEQASRYVFHQFCLPPSPCPQACLVPLIFSTFLARAMVMIMLMVTYAHRWFLYLFMCCVFVICVCLYTQTCSHMPQLVCSGQRTNFQCQLSFYHGVSTILSHQSKHFYRVSHLPGPCRKWLYVVSHLRLST